MGGGGTASSYYHADFQSTVRRWDFCCYAKKKIVLTQIEL